MELSIQNLESDVEEKQVVNVKCALKFRSIKCMGKVHNKFVQTALYIFEFLAEQGSIKWSMERKLRGE